MKFKCKLNPSNYAGGTTHRGNSDETWLQISLQIDYLERFQSRLQWKWIFYEFKLYGILHRNKVNHDYRRLKGTISVCNSTRVR